MSSTAKLTPRQKMINMLYLVLTAILALNVSNEVLDAFKNVNDSISSSNSTVREKNADKYADFAKQYAIDSAKAKEAYMLAGRARMLSQQLYNQLEDYKKLMIDEAGGIDKETGKILRDDNVDIPTRLFVENNGKRGKELKAGIEKTRKELLTLIPNAAEREKAAKTLTLTIQDPKDKRDWEFANFNHVPVVAAVTTLTKYQNDVLNAESYIVGSLYDEVYKYDTKVDRMVAMVNSPSSYILQGEAYKADVLVAAYSSTKQPEVFIGGFTSAVKRSNDGTYEPIVSKSADVPLTNAVKVSTEGGMGKLSLGAGSTGNKKYTGVVRVQGSGGEYSFYPFDGEYQVAPKTAVVAPTRMNVMYIGLENPLSISVPGFSQSDVMASINNGTVTKNADGSFTARVTTAGPAKVTVKTKTKNVERVMGQYEFRVKRVPDPITTLDGVYKGGRVRVAQLRNTRGVVALLNDFVFDAKFTVESFEFRYFSKKSANMVVVPVTGALYSSKVKDMINQQVAGGDQVFLDEIIVRGPGGDRRKINPIAFEVIP